MHANLQLHQPRSGATRLAALQSGRHVSAICRTCMPVRAGLLEDDRRLSCSPDSSPILPRLSVVNPTSNIIADGRHAASSKPQFNQARMHLAQSRCVLLKRDQITFHGMMSASPNRQRSAMHLRPWKWATKYIRDLYLGTHLYLCRQTNLCPIMLATRLPSRS